MSVENKEKYVIRDDQMDVVKESIIKQKVGIALNPGAGKTIIALTIMNQLGGTHLFVVSKSLVGNVVCEINKFFGKDFKYEILHSEFIKKIKEWTPNKDTRVVITTPEVITKSYTEQEISELFIETIRDEEAFGPAIKYYNNPAVYGKIKIGYNLIHSMKWSGLFIDEIQNHNNITTNKCLGISSICAPYRFGLSGTTFTEPKPERLLGWMLMLDISDKCLLSRSLPGIKTMLKNEKFRGFNTHTINKEIKGFVLPQYHEIIVAHALNNDEEKIYVMMKKILLDLQAKVNELKTIGYVSKTRKFSAYILAMITFLRQSLICPLIPIASVSVDITDFDNKSELTQILIKNIKESDLFEYMNNENNIYSSRIKKIIELLQTESNRRVIIFATFKSCLNIIEHCVKETYPKRKVLRMSATMSSTDREKLITNFGLETNDTSVLLATFDLMAEGVNAQVCDTMIIVDHWWNASKTSQAIKRIYRQGQKSDRVKVYMLTSNTGIEKSIFEKQSMKMEIINEYKNGPSGKKVKALKMDDILSIIESTENETLLSQIKY